MTVNINLNDLVCDTFRNIFVDIVNCRVDRAILKGGRNSTKSQVTSEAIIVGVMTYKQSAVAAVKYANKIEERLVNTFRSSIEYLGVGKYWKLRRSPFEYVLLDDFGKETDVSIKFTGCDNPENLKSYKPRSGIFRYIWFEETTNFSSFEEINNLVQTFARGKGDHCVVMCYNPPVRTSSWVNQQYNVPSGKILGHNTNSVYTEFDLKLGLFNKKIRQVVHHSTYLDVVDAGHVDWLGSLVVGEAERLKVENNRMYRWIYLGEVVGTQANVFTNVRNWDGDTSKLNIREIHRGFDWGLGGNDPCAYIEAYYDEKNKDIYILNTFGAPKMSVDDVAFWIKKYNKNNFPVYADSSVPILNGQLRNKGVNICDVSKGPGSVRAGIQFLQGRSHIYVNSVKDPDASREFTNYEYFVTKDGVITCELVDKDNHFIDSLRYAFNTRIKYFE